MYVSLYRGVKCHRGDDSHYMDVKGQGAMSAFTRRLKVIGGRCLYVEVKGECGSLYGG